MAPTGSYSLFRVDRGGSRTGKLILVWYRGCTDPALDGEFSVKKYESTKVEMDDSGWSHREIRLKRLNPDPAYRDLVFTPDAEEDLRAIGEFVSVSESTSERGRADYVLDDQSGRPLAVIEAKNNATNPYVAKQQALPYAKALDAPVIFLTNGELIYFWDYQNDDARQIAGFFSQRVLERVVEMGASREALANMEIPEHYTRQGETRTVSPYQAEAASTSAKHSSGGTSGPVCSQKTRDRRDSTWGQKRSGGVGNTLLAPRPSGFHRELTASWRRSHMTELLQEMEQQARALAQVESVR